MEVNSTKQSQDDWVWIGLMPYIQLIVLLILSQKAAMRSVSDQSYCIVSESAVMVFINRIVTIWTFVRYVKETAM